MNKTTVDQSETEDQIIETSESLRDYLRACTRQALRSVIDEEVAQLCGPRHKPDASAECRRSGSAPSYVMVNGGHEPMERPRVRLRTENGKGAEVQLKSWKLAQSQDEWGEAMMRAVLCGVSTRDIPSLRESEVALESRSSISRLWQRKSAELVKQQQESDLSCIDLVILMLDAVVLSGGMVATTALGIDADGRKHVLGFRIGSSENQQVCEDLLGALSRRGLKAPAGRHLLAVLDGSLALKNAWCTRSATCGAIFLGNTGPSWLGSFSDCAAVRGQMQQRKLSTTLSAFLRIRILKLAQASRKLAQSC